MQGHGEGHSIHHPNYIAVFIGLVLFTAASYGTSLLGLARSGTLLVIMAISIGKATLVALFFMHLKYSDRKTVYAVLAPLLLVAIIILAMWPDMVWSRPT